MSKERKSRAEKLLGKIFGTHVGRIFVVAYIALMMFASSLPTVGRWALPSAIAVNLMLVLLCAAAAVIAILLLQDARRNEGASARTVLATVLGAIVMAVIALVFAGDLARQIPDAIQGPVTQQMVITGYNTSTTSDEYGDIWFRTIVLSPAENSGAGASGTHSFRFRLRDEDLLDQDVRYGATVLASYYPRSNILVSVETLD